MYARDTRLFPSPTLKIRKVEGRLRQTTLLPHGYKKNMLFLESNIDRYQLYRDLDMQTVVWGSPPTLHLAAFVHSFQSFEMNLTPQSHMVTHPQIKIGLATPEIEPLYSEDCIPAVGLLIPVKRVQGIPQCPSLSYNIDG